jgi:hypothetical protein
MFDFSSTFGVHSIPSKKRRSGDLTQSWEAWLPPAYRLSYCPTGTAVRTH